MLVGSKRKLILDEEKEEETGKRTRVTGSVIDEEGIQDVANDSMSSAMQGRWEK